MKRALLIGIDHYQDAPLSECVTDATEMAGLLRRNADGSPNYDVRLVTSRTERIDRAGLRTSPQGLFENARDAQLCSSSQATARRRRGARNW